jgi:hypothetical protein
LHCPTSATPDRCIALPEASDRNAASRRNAGPPHIHVHIATEIAEICGQDFPLAKDGEPYFVLPFATDGAPYSDFPFARDGDPCYDFPGCLAGIIIFIAINPPVVSIVPRFH